MTPEEFIRRVPPVWPMTFNADLCSLVPDEAALYAYVKGFYYLAEGNKVWLLWQMDAKGNVEKHLTGFCPKDLPA